MRPANPKTAILLTGLLSVGLPAFGAQRNRTATLTDTSATRMAQEQELHSQAVADVEDGWSAKRMGRSLVVHQDSAKRAKQYAEHVDAVYKWLEATFPDLGPDQYVRGPILHVAKNYDEREDLLRRAQRSPWDGSSLEILVCRGNWGKKSNEIDTVSQRAMEIWFNDKDPELYAAFPQWLMSGLRDLLSDARTKRGKLSYGDDDNDRVELKRAARHKSLASIRDLLVMDKRSFEDSPAAYEQSGILLEFLAEGKGSPRKRAKGLLQRYVGALQLALEEAEPGDDQAEVVRNDAFNRTFRAWSDRDWKLFEKSFEKSYR